MRVLYWLIAVCVFLASLAFAAVAGAYAYYVRELPEYAQFDERRVFQTARILDRNGELLGEFTDPQGGNRTLVSLAQIPPGLRDATVAAEDASFYSHPGFDPRAIVRALWQAARYGRVVSGASTITQQLVKNTLLTSEVSADRKIKEALTAIELTRRYSKDKILELYLNEVYYGNLAYGVEAASQTYFGKSVSELDLAEATFIAGLPQAPATYDPYTNDIAARARQDYVLEQMVRHGMIGQADADAARSKPISLRPLEQRGQVAAPHFVVFVRQLLERSYSSDTLYREGLQIRTALDLRTQRAAERAARDQIAEIRARNASNAAVVAIQPSTGEILAMVGSVDYDDRSIAGQVNVAIQPRQPGSTLKPFTYLTAFQLGWSPATMLMDVPTTFGGTYTPLNFDNKFRGPVSVRRALATSLNVPAVRALEAVGPDAMLATAHRMGISGLRDPNRYGLSVTLGGGEVNLLDLTYAYTPFATGGMQTGVPLVEQDRTPDSRRFDPIAILEITNSAGHVLYRHEPRDPTQVIDPGLAYLITNILSDDEARAETYGRNSPLQLSRPAAAKTGTTDSFRDSWVIGYTPDLVAGVWVGNSDGSPMHDVLGATGAGKIWHGFMEEALSVTPPTPFSRPADIVEQEVCVPSGLLPTPECPKRVTELFAHSNRPTKHDDLYRRVEVCKVNGKLAFEGVPTNGREVRVFAAFPPPYSEWGPRNGYPAPPSQRCDDVYRGVKIAEIERPGPESPVRGVVQVVGSAMMDDFHHLDVEVGTGPTPTQWLKVTGARSQGVDHALLGVWDTAGFAPGRYTLKLAVYDSLGNSIEKLSPVVVGAADPTPVPSPNPSQRSVLFPTGTSVPQVVAPTPPSLIAPARPTSVPTPQPTPRRR
jgi:1A family penicillin-binding protein